VRFRQPEHEAIRETSKVEAEISRLFLNRAERGLPLTSLRSLLLATPSRARTGTGTGTDGGLSVHQHNLEQEVLRA
jgi:hypothetical protein